MQEPLEIWCSMRPELLNQTEPGLATEGPLVQNQPQSNLRDTAVKSMTDIKLFNHAVWGHNLTGHASQVPVLFNNPAFSQLQAAARLRCHLRKTNKCKKWSLGAFCLSNQCQPPSSAAWQNISACFVLTFWQTWWSVRMQGWLLLDNFPSIIIGLKIIPLLLWK